MIPDLLIPASITAAAVLGAVFYWAIVRVESRGGDGR